ncbi:hypothetical protein ERJ75_001746900 [Trypanosoma vivax]|uniref:Uncharacterized protein n=1 Tax=Trypanosoma vivax (strain Y486) TaxID=1055687 RepID=G0U2N9_TRYVY|nr:hypothetical protein TRVL_02203 [Trypanosoma vivax]KAH8604281.1 hypothetical protein ERJ75_001746900 [Trypanosoma vivax]CCC50542.1 conserved hypothetical protein [Trypanosoma vivax Y486]
MEPQLLNAGTTGNSTNIRRLTGWVNVVQQSFRVQPKPEPPRPCPQLDKLKSAIDEVMTCLKGSSNSVSSDMFVKVMEEGLRAIKAVKNPQHCNNSSETDGAFCGRTSTSQNATPSLNPNCEDSGTAIPTQVSPNCKKVSPKRIQAEGKQWEEIVAARQASALRSEERQRKAEEKRLEKFQEMKSKLEAAGERSLKAKQRRNQAVERLRNDTMERWENGARRVEEAREQKKERARRGNFRVEEVRLNNELRHQAKALLLGLKMSEAEHNLEQKREELQRQMQERNEAMLAAAERRLNLNQERIERQQQREQQRRENLRRLEEQKKLEKDMKEQRAEEWEKKAQQRQKQASEEAEARNRKVEERFQQSAQLREEKMSQLREKLEKQEQKIKEVRQRKEREGDTKPTIQELMPAVLKHEEEQLAQRLAKALACTVRQGKNFLEKYQKESSANLKELNRSKIKAIVNRLGCSSSPAPVAQCRQALRDLLGATDIGEIDHECIRYFNAYECIVFVMMESRRTNNMGVFRLAHDVLNRFLTDKKEGTQHVISFVRSGNLTPLLLCISEEIKNLKRQSRSVALVASLEILQMCFGCIAVESRTNSHLIAIRDQLLEDFDVTNIEKYCIAVARVCVSEEDLDVVQSATRLLHSQIYVLSKKKSDFPTAWFQEVSSAFFALLQNILTPNGSPLNESSPLLSSRRIDIIFTVFHVLNCLARWNLEVLQELLHDSPSSTKRTSAQPGSNCAGAEPSNAITRTELFHVLNGFFTYVSSHTNHLETIPEERAICDSTSKSFEEALKFGVTIEQSSLLAKAQTYESARSGMIPVMTRHPHHLRTALHECLLLIGYLSLQDPQIQCIFAWGKDKSLLSKVLSAMPFQYFTLARHILYPTLLPILLDSEDNLTLAKGEMNLKSLLELVKEEFEILPKKTRTRALKLYQEMNPQAKKVNSTCEPEKSNQPVSWVDLLGGEDDDFLHQVCQQPIPKKAPPRHPLWTPEKERLSKLLKSQAFAPSEYFRIDKRFPVALWPSIIEQLTTAVEGGGAP